MIITDDIKKVVETSPFAAITTVSNDGEPHTIIVGKGQVDGDCVVFGVYKMEVTQKNIAENGKMQAVFASFEGSPHGYRLIGESEIRDKSVVLKVEKAEILL